MRGVRGQKGFCVVISTSVNRIDYDQKRVEFNFLSASPCLLLLCGLPCDDNRL